MIMIKSIVGVDTRGERSLNIVVEVAARKASDTGGRKRANWA